MYICITSHTNWIEHKRTIGDPPENEMKQKSIEFELSKVNYKKSWFVDTDYYLHFSFAYLNVFFNIMLKFTFESTFCEITE